MRQAEDARVSTESAAQEDALPPAVDAGSLRALFLDLLGRPAFPGERERWLGKTRAELVDELLAGEEYWRNWLEEQLYFFLLIDNFRPTTAGVQDIPAQMAARKLGLREPLHRICLSSSFDRRNPGPDTFVSVVMEQLLGVTVQKTPRELEIGKRLYDGTPGTFLGKGGSSQADVVRIAIQDARCLEFFVGREHERLLRRTPSARDCTAWVEGLVRDETSLGALYRAWFLSPAYDERLTTRAPLPNRVFVRCLFVDLLGRMPKDDETQRIRNALDGLAESGPLRSLVARLILDSGKAELPERGAIADPGRWIDGLFERLLGRAASPEERRTFVESFQDLACRPATVLYAIVSHPEYQTW